MRVVVVGVGGGGVAVVLVKIPNGISKSCSQRQGGNKASSLQAWKLV
jgi:hypothetical protein